MLVLKKEINFYEFEDLFGYIFEGVGREGLSMIYDAVCDLFHDGGADETTVRDYLRYQLQVASLADVINDYGYIMELDTLEDDVLVELVKNYLNDYTFVLGTYEDDGETFFIFDEF